MEDISPGGSIGKPTTSDASLQETTGAAREQLAGSGRYALVSIDGADIKRADGRALRNCDGCGAANARKLGAQRSMIGIVRRVTQADDYIVVVIRAADTGKRTPRWRTSREAK